MKHTIRTILAGSALIVPLLGLGAAQAHAGRGEYCREYTKSVRINGQMQTAYGRACLQPDGDWKIVSYNGDEDLYDEVYEQAYKSLQRRQSNVVLIDYYVPRHAYYHPRPYFRWPVGYKRYYRGNGQNDRHHDGRRDRRDNGRDGHRDGKSRGRR